MTSNHHAPYDLGYTRTTMALNRGKRRSDPEQTPKTESQFGLQAATRLHEAGIASNRRSAYCGEYRFPGLVHTAVTPRKSFTPEAGEATARNQPSKVGAMIGVKS